jgi:P27 family predicted phage terminase small subunit
MGLRGPAPKPVELRLLEGNRGHRPLDISGTFRPEVAAPDAPSWLSKEARKAWRRLSPELVRYNLLSTVDQSAFAMLCQTIGRLELIERSIMARQNALMAADKDPSLALMDKTPNGLVVQSALYQVLNREQAKLHQMLASFGLRPDARTKVTAGIRAQLQLFDGGHGAAPAGTAGQANAAATDELPRGFAEF